MIVAGWRTATVDSVVPANPHARVLRLSVPGWPGNDPGQHVDIRLTAEDGYQAVRSYSLSSSGTDESIELAVDEVPDGEVSPYLVHDVMAGDELEVKGPLGGYFVWRGGDD
ncbi:MAG: oxidoreductase, partial [Microbacterium sp.]|nr:oxidoreductase [Microbacterium sp.]